MRPITGPFLVVVVLTLALNGCRSGASPVVTAGTHTPISVPRTLTPILPASTITAIPKGKTMIVSSAEDGGPGTFRQALLDAKPGDTITFDPKIFPPDNPTTIFLETDGQSAALPEIFQSHLTIDASNAGVILDGRKTRGDWVNCISIRSDGNVIRGLQIVNLPGSGIGLMDGAQNNIVGGDRTIGSGPLGQGNLSSGNRTGIDLQGDATSFNIISGNLIGTGVDGFSPRGNEGAGVYLANGASHNTIGPGNIIAHNGEGIQVYKPTSVGNTITQNSIHGNERIGISLSAEGNAYSAPPSIIGYDLSAGSIAVFTCAHCTIEIFSDGGGQGETFEGQGKADDRGVLTLDRGFSFVGPHLTAVATDVDGNTSGFSLPTSDTRKPASDALGSMLIQGGNNLPIARPGSRQSGELEDNKMGTFTGGLWHPEYEPEVFPEGLLDARYIREMGFKRFRLTINNLDSIKVDWSKPEFSIDPGHDKFVSDLADSGIKITYVLSFWDIAYRAEGGEIPIPRFKTEDEVQRYLDYVQFIVHHFKDRIEYYEIWNEPNLVRQDDDGIQRMEAEDYINLVKRVVPVIRGEYPRAKIVVGSTSSLIDTGSQSYLFKILESDVMLLADVVATHPMYGSSPEYDDHRQYYLEYPALVRRIEAVAAAHGFKGEYEADEIHWPTPAQPEPGWPTYSDTQSIKYLTRSIVMHRGMDVIVTQLLQVGSTKLHRTNAYLSTLLAGAEPVDLPAEIQSEAANIKSYGFSLSNGDQLLALWNDGVAVDYDPGIPAAVTIPGHADWNAVGVDVLNGFEQKLITGGENGNLIIADLSVKDYPLIIRLSQ